MAVGAQTYPLDRGEKALAAGTAVGVGAAPILIGMERPVMAIGSFFLGVVFLGGLLVKRFS